MLRDKSNTTLNVNQNNDSSKVNNAAVKKNFKINTRNAQMGKDEGFHKSFKSLLVIWQS